MEIYQELDFAGSEKTFLKKVILCDAQGCSAFVQGFARPFSPPPPGWFWLDEFQHKDTTDVVGHHKSLCARCAANFSSPPSSLWAIWSPWNHVWYDNGADAVEHWKAQEQGRDDIPECEWFVVPNDVCLAKDWKKAST